MPGMNQLPVEFQILFWIMILFLGTLCSLVVYWTKRYIDSQDKRLESHESKMKKITETLEDASKDMRSASINVKMDFVEFRKEVSQTNEAIKKETYDIRRDLSTAQTRMIVLKESLEDVSRKATLVSKLLEDQTNRTVDVMGKVTLLEQNQSKIITVIKQLSDRLTFVGTKKDDGSKS